MRGVVKEAGEWEVCVGEGRYILYYTTHARLSHGRVGCSL